MSHIVVNKKWNDGWFFIELGRYTCHDPNEKFRATKIQRLQVLVKYCYFQLRSISSFQTH